MCARLPTMDAVAVVSRAEAVAVGVEFSTLVFLNFYLESFMIFIHAFVLTCLVNANVDTGDVSK